VVQGGGVGGLGSAGRLQSPQRRWSQSAWAENVTLAHAVPSFFVRRVSEFNPSIIRGKTFQDLSIVDKVLIVSILQAA
jgi:hypothetical protein